jgi:acetate kinase
MTCPDIPIGMPAIHLGAGASLAAARDGRCLDTTMGFTPLEGLVMATRSGSVDPGLLLWLLEETGMAERELAEALEHESGLLARTADMREVLAGVERGDSDASLALDVYVHHRRAGIAAMAAALGGLDTLVFTGGVGERSAPVRAAAAAGLGFLGIVLDPERNATAGDDADIGAGAAAARTLVVEAREDLEIARQARAVVAAGRGTPRARISDARQARGSGRAVLAHRHLRVATVTCGSACRPMRASGSGRPCAADGATAGTAPHVRAATE